MTAPLALAARRAMLLLAAWRSFDAASSRSLARCEIAATRSSIVLSARRASTSTALAVARVALRFSTALNSGSSGSLLFSNSLLAISSSFRSLLNACLSSVIDFSKFREINY